MGVMVSYGSVCMLGKWVCSGSLSLLICGSVCVYRYAHMFVNPPEGMTA